MIVGIKRTNGYDYVDNYDQYGKRYGQLKAYQARFKSWTPTYTGGIGSASYNSRGFAGKWGQCVGAVLTQMMDGSENGIVKPIYIR